MDNGNQDLSLDDEDAFWEVAFMGTNEAGAVRHDDDGSTDNDTNEYATTTTTRSYTCIIPNSNGVALHLQPLPSFDGVWTSLGADAWYGSALLSAYITSALRTTRQRNKAEENVDKVSSTSPLHSKLQSIHKRNKNNDTTSFTILELGSGAVGMAGLCLAWSLKHHAKAQTRDARIILTDYEPNLLGQLQRNVDQNAHLWRTLSLETSDMGPTQTNNVHVDVKFLDWGQLPTDWDDYLGLTSSNNDTIDLIVGSELVYTPENAVTCRDCVLSLMECFPTALVCILQIVDRPGWANIFLPGLRDVAELYVKEESVDVDCDVAASAMMKRGGSLDRFDFGICYISRKEL